MTKIDLEEYVVESWDLDDDRLPVNEDIIRTPPSADFIASMRNYKQLYPILMCHNKKDGWFIGFGNKRLLALRILQEEDPDKFKTIFVRIGEDIARDEAYHMSLIENAQRSGNDIHAYKAIEYLLKSDKKATYKSIAQKIHMPTAFVKATVLKYGRIPEWCVQAALDGKIAETTIVAVGKFKKNIQEECRKEYEASGKLPLSVAKDKKKFIQTNIVAKMSPAMGFAVPTSNRKQFYPLKDLEELKKLLDAKKYKQAVQKLEELLT